MVVKTDRCCWAWRSCSRIAVRTGSLPDVRIPADTCSSVQAAGGGSQGHVERMFDRHGRPLTWTAQGVATTTSCAMKVRACQRLIQSQTAARQSTPMKDVAVFAPFWQRRTMASTVRLRCDAGEMQVRCRHPACGRANLHRRLSKRPLRVGGHHHALLNEGQIWSPDQTQTGPTEGDECRCVEE